MAREKVDNKLNVVVGTKAQIVGDTTIPDNSIVIVTDEELTPSGSYEPDGVTIILNNSNELEVSKDLEVEWTKVVNKPTFSTVATTGSYNDLNGKPDLTTKLDKDFSTLPNQASPLLTDVLAINRGTVAQKTTLGNLLAQVDAEIFVVVASLPTTGVVNKIYLLPKGTPESQDGYDEFIWVNNAWELIGSVKLDLSNYYNITQIDGMLSGYVAKEVGKGLSANDYTNTDKQSVEKIPTIEQDILDLESDKVDKNNAITAGTKAKITYDSKGLVTAGADLAAADIPTLPASKITQTTTARFVTDTEKSTWNGKQNALTAGDGISISGNVISADGGLSVETWNTATKTLALSDANKLFKCSHTANQTLTIPTNATVAFPIGTMITFLLTSTNAVTFSGASGVTLTSIDSLVELKTQFAMASLIKTDTNTWQLVGALE